MKIDNIFVIKQFNMSYVLKKRLNDDVLNHINKYGLPPWVKRKQRAKSAWKMIQSELCWLDLYISLETAKKLESIRIATNKQYSPHSCVRYSGRSQARSVHWWR